MKRVAFISAMIIIALFIKVNAASAGAGTGKIPTLFQASYDAEAAGNFDKAVNSVLQILRMDPKLYIAMYRLGWLYYLKGAYEDSVEAYDKAAALAPGSLEASLASMQPLIALKQWAKTEEIAFKILKGCDSNYLARSRLAYAYFLEGRYKEAQTQYRQVLKLYPSDMEMALGLAWSLLKEGKAKDAKPIFEKVLSIIPADLNARSGLEACK